MNFDIMKLEGLTKDSQIPKTVEEQVEETWFVRYGEEIVGVGLFLPDAASCVLAIVGNSDEDRRILGSYGSSDEHGELVRQGLEIAFEGYLRSVKGDTVIGRLDVGED